MKLIDSMKKRDKESYPIPKSIQQWMPIHRVYPDGIFLYRDRYSKTFRFTDVNYKIASPDDQRSMFMKWCAVINSLDVGASIKLTLFNRRVNKNDYTNLDRAIAALNNQVIVKGKSFSFNEIVGPRTAENGFTTAPNGNGVPVMGGGVSQIATTLNMAMKNLSSDLVYEQLYAFGTAYNAGYVESAAETVLTDYSRNLDYRFTSNHAENMAISMWRSDSMIFCQLTGIGDATTVPTDEPEETPVPEPVQPTEPDQPAEPVESTVQRMKVVNVNSYVNLRQSPSTQSESQMQIPRDAVVEYTGERDGDFLKVSYESKIGYVHGKYLEKMTDAPAMLTVVNCQQSVTLRAEPSRSAAALADIPLGAEVEDGGITEGEYRKVVYQGQEGYVLDAYLK